MDAMVHGEIRTVRCYRCSGQGTVPDEMAAWIALGKAIKERRMTPYRPLWVEAKRLGIDAKTLSDMEQGYCDPAEVIQ